jgi:hypothetical protein
MRSWSVGRTSIVVAASVMCLALVAACGSGGSKGGSAPTASASTSAASPTQSSGGAGNATVPTSCAQVPLTLIQQYLPGASLAASLGPVAHGVSCEFIGGGGSSVIILNIGSGGTATQFATLRTTSGGGGRTTTDVSGLGVSAFSISKNGKVAGVDAISSTGVVFSVGSTLTLAQDEQLITQLMALY